MKQFIGALCTAVFSGGFYFGAGVLRLRSLPPEQRPGEWPTRGLFLKLTLWTIIAIVAGALIGTYVGDLLTRVL